MSFSYTIADNIITISSGSLTGLKGTVSGTSMYNINWDNDVLYTMWDGEVETESCSINLAGQYTSSYLGQRLTFVQSGCRGTASGDMSFSYTIVGNIITITSGSLIGLKGTISGTSMYSINWDNSVFYTMSNK